MFSSWSRKRKLRNLMDTSGLTNKCVLTVHLVRQTKDEFILYPYSKITEEYK